MATTDAVLHDLVFYVNKNRFSLLSGTYDPAQPLASFIRENTRYTGTKISCNEGGCGACTVLGTWFPTVAHAQRNEPVHRSLNACLRLLAQCDGMVITTTEGIGSHRNAEGHHAVQKCIAKNNGSQCGMCTPGMVMSLFSYLVAKPDAASTTPENAAAKVEQALDGNLCRCTGYRPLLTSAHELVKPGAPTFNGPDMPTEFRTRAEQMLVCQPSSAHNLEARQLVWVRPVSLAQVVQTLSSLGAHARLVNGHTSYGVARSMVAMGNQSYSNLLPENAEAGQVNVDISRVSELWTNGELHTKSGAVVSSSLSAFLSSTATEDNQPTKVVFGSAVSMTDLTSKLDALITSLPAAHTATFSPLVKHMHRVAGFHVRNVGSWVGGLVLARDCAFPSDLAVILHAARAKLAILNVATELVEYVSVGDYVLGWKKSNKASGVTEVVVSLEIPFSNANTHFETFKTALRVQNSHALVNAAFSCDVDASGVVSHARLVYGALGKDHPFMSATIVEYAVNGKTLGTEFLDAGMASLHADVIPVVQMEPAYITASQPEGKLAFRRGTVLAFFYKFYLGLMYRFKRQSLDPRLFSMCNEPERPAMQATENFEPADEGMSPVGEPIPKLAAILQASGEAKYAGDSLAATGAGGATQGVLHGAMVLNSIRATGTLVEVDASAALAMPGVVRVLTAADVPGVNAGASADEPLFVPVGGKVCYVGQPVALVVATSAYLAENAAKLVVVQVTHSGDLNGSISAVNAAFPPKPIGVGKSAVNRIKSVMPVYSQQNNSPSDVRHLETLSISKQENDKDEDEDEEAALTIADAIRLKRFYPLVPALSELHCGDIDEAFKTADCVAELNVESGPSVHFYIEKQTTVAVPDEDRMIVYPATQNPPSIRSSVSKLLGVHGKYVSVKVRRTGGAFGGKGSRAVIPACAAALAAHVLGTPVAVTLEIYADQAMSGTRMTMEANMKVAFDEKTGRMSGLQVGMYVAGGAYPDATAGAIRELVLHVDGVYDIPNWNAVAKACRLNVAPRTFVRAPGHLQSTLIIESVLDKIAEVTGLDPVAVRERNLYTARTAITPFLEPMLGLGFSLPRVWQRIKDVSQLTYKQHDVDAFNQSNRWRKRGLAVSPVKYGVGAMRGGSLVSVDKDGTVSVFHSGVEIGQGIHTRVAQVASQTLGAPLECIVIRDTDTDVVSQIGGTGGSATTGSAAEAVRVACLKLNSNMAGACSSSTNETDCDSPMKLWVDKVNQAVSWGVEMSVEAHAVDAPGRSGDPRGGADGAWANATGVHYAQYCFGAACSVVEVDCLTGQVTILETDIVYDMGKSLNPALDIGQIEGAFMMGVGFHLHEEVLYDKTNSRVVSNGTWEYKPPCAADVPLVFNVELLRDSPFMKGTLRSKAVGEPPQMLSVSVFAATRRAVMESRVERGLSPWDFQLDVPATVDRVQQALEVNTKQF